ncbi:MAG TPA: hypothetical protein PKD64_02835 [Pirellulaceae bacterium]|nr:hypothetical protein [Pirellulaceae bacterium]HMO91104.1 hypothetical protein [Pirellulaceae bacterium]HMP70548.1 hypothetical protein [Pirellulaceae bacterium]
MTGTLKLARILSTLVILLVAIFCATELASAQNVSFSKLMPFRKVQPVKPISLTDIKPSQPPLVYRFFQPTDDDSTVGESTSHGFFNVPLHNVDIFSGGWINPYSKSIRAQGRAPIDLSFPLLDRGRKMNDSQYILPPPRSAIEPDHESIRRF